MGQAWEPLGYLRSVRDAELGGMHKLVLTMLLSRSDACGEAYPSITRLARDAGVGTSTVRRSLRDLERAGWIRTTQERGGSSVYQLTHPNHSGGGLSQPDCPTPTTQTGDPNRTDCPPNQPGLGPQPERLDTPVPLVARTTHLTTQTTVDVDERPSGVLLTKPIVERAKEILRNPYDGRFDRPSTWPEVQRVFAAWCAPWKLELKLGDDATQGDLKAVLQALADGYSPDDLVRCGELASKDAFFARQRRPGPASFKPGVIGGLLSAGAAPSTPAHSASNLKPLPPMIPGAAAAARAAALGTTTPRPPVASRPLLNPPPAADAPSRIGDFVAVLLRAGQP